MISIIICSIDQHKFAAVSDMYRKLLAPGPFEIIPISDATGMADGYTRGFADSRGEVVIFSHDDVEFLASDFRGKIEGHLQHCDVLGIEGATALRDGQLTGAGPPYTYGQIAVPNYRYNTFDVSMWSVPSRRCDGMKALDGVFICTTRKVAEAVCFDYSTFTGFHLYDLDFSFRAYLAGYRLSVANDLYLIHRSIGQKDEAWQHAKLLFEKKFAEEIDKLPSRPFRTSVTAVSSRAEIIEVMTPPHWSAASATLRFTVQI